MPNNRRSDLSRRDIMRGLAATAAVSAGADFVFGAAPDRPLKIGLVGCGGRGTGAGLNAMNADPDVKVAALADVYPEALASAAKQLGAMHTIDEKNWFAGY